jgi:mitofilin
LPVAAVVAAGGAAGLYYYYSTSTPPSDTKVAVSTIETKTPETSVPEILIPDKPLQEEEEETATIIAEPIDSSDASAGVAAGDEAAGETLSLPSEGNRVASILIPSKMRNTESGTARVIVPAHPEAGHRVHSIPLTTKMNEKGPIMPEEQSPPPIADKTTTVKALEKLQTTTREEAVESLIRSHQSVWQFRDLDEQNPAELKARIVQLATELQDRTKWEAIRLKEFLIMKEKETEEKCENDHCSS